jgi:hydroxymethylpyrimidine/phosphomethylpyrimidine kinase
MTLTPPVVLTIAGLDPSSGAGITADIKTIAAHGCYGMAAITAMTVQSTSGVRQIAPTDPELLTHTLEEVTADVAVSAVHIGMLSSGAVAEEVAEFLTRARLPNVVLDPILKSSSGTELIDKAGIEVIRKKLLPLSSVITPNADEAAALTGMQVWSVDDMSQAADKLHEMGAAGVVITGGHLEKAVDLLSPQNGRDVQIFKAGRLQSNCTHGTGCAFSTAIACHLASGRALAEAVMLAKAFVTAAIASGYPLGKGIAPVNHMYRMRNHPRAGGMMKTFVTMKD